MAEIVLKVSGMACGGCVSSVQSVLTALPGVQHAEVTLTPPQARVVYDDAVVTPPAFALAISEAGFGISD